MRIWSSENKIVRLRVEITKCVTAKLINEIKSTISGVEKSYAYLFDIWYFKVVEPSLETVLRG